MVFLDGVGFGSNEASVNPFFSATIPALRSLLGGVVPSLQHQVVSSGSASLVPLDACLGVEGLPQSGTGQTALFTGVNSAQLIGKHFGPHPYSSLRPVIEERNIFKQLLGAGRRPCFANAFPQRFFDYMTLHPARMSVTTLSCHSAGLQLRQAAALSTGKAVSADITGEGWRDLGYPDMPVVSPQEAGRRLAMLTLDHDFVLFEYWKTDYAGHSGDMAEAIAVIERFDGLLGGILDALDMRSTLLIITSDHGNLEDMTTKSHTRNPVPAILYGCNHDIIAAEFQGCGTAPDLTHVTPVLLKHITGAEAVPRS